MKAIVNYISKSGKSALIAINVPIAGTKLSTNVSGFVACEVDAYKKGDTIDLPVMKIEVIQKPTDDGVLINWLQFK